MSIEPAIGFLERVEAELGNGDTGGAEHVLDVAQMVVQVSRSDVEEGVARAAVQPAIRLDLK